MLNSSVLEVGIGLVFCFLFVSLILTALRETIETWMRTRTFDLERALAEMLDDRPGTGLRKKLMDHPLIRGLYPGTYVPTAFPDRPDSPGAWVWKIISAPFRLMIPTRNAATKPSYIPARQFALALIDLAESKKIAAASPVRRALETLSTAAGGDAEKLKGEVEAWYNDSMERATGWYRRRTQWILLFLGLFVAIGLNVNAVVIAQALSTDAVMRKMVADRVTALVDEQNAAATPEEDEDATASEGGGDVTLPDGTGEDAASGAPEADGVAPGAAGSDDAAAGAPEQDGVAPDPAGSDEAAAGAPEDEAVAPDAEGDEDATPADEAGTAAAPADDTAGTAAAEPEALDPVVAAKVRSLMAEIELPIGWTDATVSRMSAPLAGTTGLERWALLASLAMGYLITGLAATLGAPFWFDVLSRFTTIRSTVKPKPVPPDEAPA